MNLLTTIFPLLCFTSMCLLVTNANPTFEGYRYEKPSIAFEYTSVTKRLPKLPKNADIKPTATTKVASEKIATKSKLNGATATKASSTTMATAAQQQQQQQQHQEKSNKKEKIEKSTVINPTAIKETNLNTKSNKNPATATKTTPTSTKTKTTAERAETVIKIKTEKLNLNQLTNSISGTTGSGSVYVQQENGNLNSKHQLDVQKTDSTVLTALENLLNRNNDYIYRISTNAGQHPSFRGLNLSHTPANDKLALNHPLERRLSPYTETLADKEYFE